MAQLPKPSARAVPTTPSSPLLRATVLFGSAVPNRVMDVLLVTLSLSLAPLSSAGRKSGADGGAGAAESSVRVGTSAAADRLPSPSSAMTTKLLAALATNAAVRLQVPPLTTYASSTSASSGNPSLSTSWYRLMVTPFSGCVPLIA